MNNGFYQLQGPFTALEELITQIKNNSSDFQYIKQIGIQSIPSHICHINGQIFEIGKTGILEISESKITSIYFDQNETEATIIDCILD